MESEMSAFSNGEESPTKLPDIGRNIGKSELKTQGGGIADI